MSTDNYNREYYDKMIRQFKLDLNTKTDADIIAKLESVKNRAGYIKQLIREDLQKS